MHLFFHGSLKNVKKFYNHSAFLHKWPLLNSTKRGNREEREGKTYHQTWYATQDNQNENYSLYTMIYEMSHPAPPTL